MNGIGRRLRRLREARGITQAGLARRLRVDQSTLSRWENGRRPIPVASLLAAARLLDVSVDEILRPRARAR